MDDDLSSLADNRQATTVVPKGITTDQFRFYVWAIWGLFAIVIAGALWYARVESKLADSDRKDAEHDKLLAHVAAQTESLNAYMVANNLVNSIATSTVNRLTERVTKNENRLDAIDKQVTELWFMRQHGISNKEAFFQDHGFAAPEGLEKRP